MQFDLNIVAAFLTIIGYSLNDTVVIYDRIRENMRKFRKMEIVSLLNLSVNETLSRTIVTSLSIMLAWRAAAFGPAVLFGFTDRDDARHRRRHLFVDLHLVAILHLARREERQLRADARKKTFPDGRSPPDPVGRGPACRVQAHGRAAWPAPRSPR